MIVVGGTLLTPDFGVRIEATRDPEPIMPIDGVPPAMRGPCTQAWLTQRVSAGGEYVPIERVKAGTHVCVIDATGRTMHYVAG